MGLFHHESSEAKGYDQVINAGDHKGHLSHDAIASAIAYEAAKQYEKHCEKNGKPSSHSKAKEVLAGLAAAAATHLVETKGLNYIDKKKAEHDAKKLVEEASASQY